MAWHGIHTLEAKVGFLRRILYVCMYIYSSKFLRGELVRVAASTTIHTYVCMYILIHYPSYAPHMIRYGVILCTGFASGVAGQSGPVAPFFDDPGSRVGAGAPQRGNDSHRVWDRLCPRVGGAHNEKVLGVVLPVLGSSSMVRGRPRWEGLGARPFRLSTAGWRTGFGLDASNEIDQEHLWQV